RVIEIDKDVRDRAVEHEADVLAAGQSIGDGLLKRSPVRRVAIRCLDPRAGDAWRFPQLTGGVRKVEAHPASKRLQFVGDASSMEPARCLRRAAHSSCDT